jgi:hypothetical protein
VLTAARKSAATGRQTTHGIVFDWQHWAASAGIPREDFRNSSSRSHSNFFGTYDIVAHPQLSREMKLSLLRQWEQTARSLSVAESEGMGSGEENMLGRVELAIALVEKQPLNRRTRHQLIFAIAFVRSRGSRLVARSGMS